MSKASLLLFTLSLALSISAQNISGSKAKTGLTPATTSAVVQDWRAGTALASLIQMGFSNHLPIGIVLEGESLCKSKVSGSSESISLSTLINQVNTQDSSYTAELRNNVLYVHPKVMRVSTLKALELQIPSFNAGGSSAQEVAMNLWMNIRGVLVPQESSMFAGGFQKDAEVLPDMHLEKLTVHQILDRIVATGQGGLWVMNQVPAGWQVDPKTQLHEIWSYSGDQHGAERLTCPNTDATSSN